jgi:predicted O-linked N-acetylglucosamine transferase (SPINDLY family)
MPSLAAALQLALQHHRAGRLAEAQTIYQRILEADAQHPDALHLLGLIAHQQGQHARAADLIRQAIALRPTAAEFHTNLGVVCRELGRQADAVACYRRALQLKPHLAEAHNNLGVVLQDQEELDAAVACFRRALALKPDYAEAANNLGTALQEQGDLDAATACFEQALQQNPHYATAWNNLGTAFKDQGYIDRAIDCFQRALSHQPDYTAAHSNLLFTLHYRDGIRRGELAEAHARFHEQHAATLATATRPPVAARQPDQPLRLGFVSPDLAAHPVGLFLIRALENLDRQQFQVVCYSDRLLADAITRRFQAVAHAWRDVCGVPDEQLAEQIRADRVDMLFDLSGHTARNRMLVFARRPAPIQITWLGYVGTTGLQAMDYLLADRHEIPPDAEPDYREKVLRLPDGYVCFDPPSDAPPVSPLPALTAGHVTLGSFNNPAKLTPAVVATWSEILARLPDARLLLRYRGLDSRAAQSRLRELFARHGIDARRVELSGRAAPLELLAYYAQLDLALDPFTYSGGLTTCEALWMGVPVITCPGETFASRHAFSHLTTVGLTEAIARDRSDYVERVVALAHDLPRLSALRVHLRAQVAASPLCDGKRFAANLARLLRGIPFPA